MALSKRARNEIAWKLLLHKLEQMQFKEVTKRKLHDRFKKLSTHLPSAQQSICDGKIWDFCSDLIESANDADSGESGQDLDDVQDFELSEEERLTIGYSFYLCLFYEKSIRVGKNTRREWLDVTAKLKIDEKDALSFLRSSISTLLMMVVTK